MLLLLHMMRCSWKGRLHVHVHAGCTCMRQRLVEPLLMLLLRVRCSMCIAIAAKVCTCDVACELNVRISAGLSMRRQRWLLRLLLLNGRGLCVCARRHSSGAPVNRADQLPLPAQRLFSQSQAAIVARAGQYRAGNVPVASPHRLPSMIGESRYVRRIGRGARQLAHARMCLLLLLLRGK